MTDMISSAHQAESEALISSFSSSQKLGYISEESEKPTPATPTKPNMSFKLMVAHIIHGSLLVLHVVVLVASIKGWNIPVDFLEVFTFQSGITAAPQVAFVLINGILISIVRDIAIDADKLLYTFYSTYPRHPKSPSQSHLGLVPPQDADMDDDHSTPYMRSAPYPNPDRLNSQEDQMVADPLSTDIINLWTDTSRQHREIFTEVFRPVPSNLVRDWAREIFYTNYEDFLIDDKGFVEGPD
ncbi:hypothetical protein HHX47_DHR2000907 [Lentinula edodes]|nr:hypothetical protein HHX47_DHR2000907 [Lentinula edodes]